MRSPKGLALLLKECPVIADDLDALLSKRTAEHARCELLEAIPLLQSKAKELSKEFGYELVIFPGFEFTAHVGKGIHVLAIFEPDADLNEIDHILVDFH